MGNIQITINKSQNSRNTKHPKMYNTNAFDFVCLSCVSTFCLALADTVSEDVFKSEELRQIPLTYVRHAESITHEDTSGEKSYSFPGLMPEMVRYARHRCSVDLPRANVNWSLQNFHSEAEARDTHCYVKCFIRRVGLIRLRTLGWDLNRLNALYWNFGGTQTFPSNCFAALNEAREMSGACEPYYSVWINLFRTCRLGFNYFFYHDVRLNELPFVRAPSPYRVAGVEPFQFCAILLSEYNLDAESTFFTFCTYLQLHYFDGYGRMDPTEMRRSFAETGRLTAVNEGIIDNCAHRANAFYIQGQNGKEMAKQMSDCMLEKLPEEYLRILRNWNNKMRNY